MFVVLAGLAGLSTCRKEEPAPQKPQEAPTPQASETATIEQEQPASQAGQSQQQPAQKPASLLPQPTPPTADTSGNLPVQQPTYRSTARIITAEDQAVAVAQAELTARWDEHKSVSAKVISQGLWGA